MAGNKFAFFLFSCCYLMALAIAQNNDLWTGPDNAYPRSETGTGAREQWKTVTTSTSRSASALSNAITTGLPKEARSSIPARQSTGESATSTAEGTISAVAIVESSQTSSVVNQPGADMGDGDEDDREDSIQMVIIILSSLAAAIFLVVLGLFVWHYYKRHQQRSHATRLPSPDETEFEKWRVSSMPATPRVGEYRDAQSPLPLQSPLAAQSHVSQRYYASPKLSHSSDRGQSLPSSSHGLLKKQGSFGCEPSSEDNKRHRYSNSAQQPRGYMQHRAERTRSTQSLTTRRAPTPLFGDETVEERDDDVPRVPKPVRPRSTPMSPLAGSPMSSPEFEFGFDRRLSIRRVDRRYSNTSELSLNNTPAAPPKQF